MGRIANTKLAYTKRIAILFTSMFLSVTAFSQQNFTVTAKLKLQDEPAAAATVMLLNKDSVIVKTALANKSGEFRLLNVDSGYYTLMVTHTGSDPFTMPLTLEGASGIKDLGSLSLQRSASTLEKVIVQGQKPVIEYKTDRVIFNISEKMQKASRNSADLLNKAPGVVLGRDDKLQIDGQSNILVTVNGKQRFASKEDALQFLRNVPAEQVLSIEVVQQPSAKYDQSAGGGILNIVLKKDETQGLQGTWNGYFSSGAYNRYGTGINLNYRQKKTNLYALYNYGRDIQYELADNSQQVAFGSGTYVVDQDYNTIKKPDYHNLRTGIDYSLNKKHVLGLLANFMFNDQDISRHTATSYHPAAVNQFDSLIRLNESKQSSYERMFLNFNYNGVFGASNSKTLNADVSYLRDDLSNESVFLHQYYNSGMAKFRPDFKLHNNIPSLVDLVVGRLEYSQAFKNDFTLEAGIKITHSETDNNVQYDTVVNETLVKDIFRTAHYVYTEDVNAIYTNVSRFGKKRAWSAGLRYEAAAVKGRTIGQPGISRQFNGLFPNFSYRYTINKNNRIAFMVKKSLARPDFIKLNPFIQYTSQTFYTQGNPDLKQFDIYISSVRYSYKRYNFTLRYDYLRNYIPQELLVREGSSFVSKATYANAADLHGLQFTIYIPVERFKWWSSYNNINIFHNNARGRDAKFTGLNFTNTNANLYSSNIFTLPFNITGELNLSIGTNSRNNQTIYKGNYGVDVRLTRSVIRNLVKLSLSYEDITYQSISRGYSDYNGIINNFSVRNDTRRIGIAASFQFGHTKVAGRRQRSTGTEDEENRIKKF